MQSIISNRQGRLRPSFIWIVVLLVVLAACSNPGEPEATAVVARETATSEPVVEATDEPTAEPTAETAEPTDEPVVKPTPAPTAGPTVESAPIPEKGQVTFLSNEISFEVLGQYGGLPAAVAAADGVAYAGFGPRLVTLDVSDPANPRMLGETSLLEDNIRDIALVDGLVYLAAGRAGLAIVDVTDVANPTIVSAGPNYGGAHPPSAYTVQVDGQMAYLTDYQRTDGKLSLLQFNISDPAAPMIVSSAELQVNDSVVVDGGRVVIAGNGRIQLRDSAELGEVAGVARIAGGDYQTQVIVEGDRAFVVQSGSVAGVEVFDISDVANPVVVGEITPVEIFIGTQAVADETTIYSVGTFGEFGFCDSQITVIDISGEEPVGLPQLSPEVCVTDVFAGGGLLFVSGRSGLRIFDVSNPGAAELVGSFVNPDGFHGAEGVALNGDVTYILAGEGSGAEIRTVSLNGETAELLNAMPLGGTVILDLFLANNALIAPQWQGWLQTFSLADPIMPASLFTPESEGGFSTGDIFSNVLDGDVFYIPIVDGVLIGGIGVVDLSDPANPVLVSTFETGDYQVMHMVAGNGYLYALAQGDSQNIHIYDLDDPLAPVAVATVAMPEYTKRLGLVGNTLYAACDSFNCQSLFAIDVTEPGAAEINGRWQMNAAADELVPFGDGLFLMTDYEDGIWVLDVSDPENPLVAGRLQLPGDYARLKVVDGVVYAAVYDGGLYIISAASG